MTGFIAPSIKQLISSIERQGLRIQSICWVRQPVRINGRWHCEIVGNGHVTD